MNMNIEKKYINLMKQASSKMSKLQLELDALKEAIKEPIAIIGMGCRFPGGANNPEAFWQLLATGVDAIREVPADRWEIDAYYSPDPEAAGKMYTRYGGFIESLDESANCFDPHFFGIAPREALSLDPQQRLLLEVSWEALEHAAVRADDIKDSQTGVFIGICGNDYLLHLLKRSPSEIDAYLATGNAHSTASGRLSYIYGLQGPSLAVDTACSSSLVAVHLAVMSLRNKECDLALAGGVNRILSPEMTINFCRARMLSPDGRCKTFDAAANGFVRAEGCGIIVLKRLSDARADNDHILAVIRGSAINQDGQTSGLTVPNGPSQQAVIAAALENGGVTPAEVSYIEAHGTGTSLGDPIEVGALGALFGRKRDEPLIIGSVKSNIGHAEGAAGIAGLIKALLALQHKQIPPTLHFKNPNPYISWHELPIKVATERMAWPSPSIPPNSGGEGRIAGVSSFGFSGTNAHVVLEAYAEPAQQPKEVEGAPKLHLLCLSAKTENALGQLAQRYLAYFQGNPAPLADVCFTANTSRTHFEHRYSIVAADSNEAREKLALLVAGESVAGVYQGKKAATKARPDGGRIAFLFTGQGSQYVQMGRELYESQPTFRQTLDQCDRILRAQGIIDKPLLSLLYPRVDDPNASILLNETQYTQVTLLALEYALAKLWESWGVVPDVVMGHSVGELVAACVAGVFSLEDGLKLVAERGRLMQSTAPGQMVAIFAPEAEVKSVIGTQACADVGSKCSIAAINGPQLTVISGTRLEQIVSQFERKGIRCQPLTVSYLREASRVGHAFHSPLMEPILSDFRRVAQQVQYSSPKTCADAGSISLISNVTGAEISSEVTKPEYWVRHIRQPVRFADSMNTLIQMGIDTFVEIGPKPVLLNMGRRSFPDERFAWLPTLRQNRSDWSSLLSSVGQLYVHGVEIDWAGFDQDYPRRKVVLPTYPFQRERYWVDLPKLVLRPKEVQEVRKRGRDALRPLIDKMTKSPLLSETLFETEFSLTALPFLSDHRVNGAVVSPAACHLAMVFEGARLAFGKLGCQIGDVIFPQALMVPEDDEARTVQLLFTPVEGGIDFQLVSFLTPQDAEQSVEQTASHATGHVALAVQNKAKWVSLDELRAGCQEEIAIGRLYQALEMQGLEFGPHFRWVEKIWRGEGQVLGKLRLPSVVSTTGYVLHPGLLDGCLQLSGMVQDENEIPKGHAVKELYLPFAVEALRLYQPANGDEWWCHIKNKPGAWDIQLIDSYGQVVLELVGFSVRVASQAALQAPPRYTDWLCTIEWQAQSEKSAIRAATERAVKGNWLVFGEVQGIGEALVSQLHSLGAQATLVVMGPQHESRGEMVIVDPERPEEFQRLLEELVEKNDKNHGVVYLWGAEFTESAARGVISCPLGTSVPEFTERLCGGALHLVQALVKSELHARLWLVTQGSQAAGDNHLLSSPHQEDDASGMERSSAGIKVGMNALWGLGRTIMSEFPQLSCTCLDLDDAPRLRGDSSSDAVQTLLVELSHNNEENQVAFANNQRHVARLTRLQLEETKKSKQPMEVRLSDYGTVEHLQLVPMQRQTAGPNEVEVEVKAAGLNFRDVLNTLGMLQEYVSEHLGIHNASDLPLGFECAGTVIAVGEEVTELVVGDMVMGLAVGSLANVVTAPANMMVRVPAGMTAYEAATIPLTFLTAYYGLSELANIQAGDRILIHSAAGGVGQAAVQLAQAAGAEVFGTASLGKWDVLRASGVSHLMNSRTLDFAQEVLAITQGQGVDVVLNSLNGEFIDRSFEALGHGGRFVEIGKLAIWSVREVQMRRPDVAYYPFDLGEVMAQEPDLVPRLWRDLLGLFKTGQLKPLPHTVFPMQKVKDAFRFMQRAKHTGKVVISFAEPEQTEIRIHDNASYLITGGLGALGLQVAKLLVGEGVRHLILSGRRGALPAAKETIQQLEAVGAEVRVVTADVAKQEDVARLLAACQERATLKGIVHAAGVLDDGVLMQQSLARFEKVMSPKIKGAWNLHQQTSQIPLDFFVLFSSAASLLGSAGQANYAAANAFMDGLAHYRHSLALPALSINWGPWADTGMAARLASRLKVQGIGMIAPEDGLQVLGKLFKDAKRVPQVGVLPVDWSKFMAHQKTPFFSTFAPASLRQAQGTASQTASGQSFSDGDIYEILSAAPADERRSLLMEHLRAAIGAVMGLGEDIKLEPHERLFDLGLDSLMAIELKNLLESSLRQPLRSTLLFNYPTLSKLADHLAQEVLSLPKLLEAVQPPDMYGQDMTASGEDEANFASTDDFLAQLENKLEEIERMR